VPPLKSTQRKRKIEDVSLRERNQILLRAIVDIFDLGKAINLEALKKNISDAQIRELYTLIARLWPLDTDLAQLIRPSGTALRALYMGDVVPEQLIRNVCRFSLYADEIVIVDPFHNPLAMSEEYSPLANPGQWKMDTLKLIAFAMFLGPWIDAGLVSLVPDPGTFDYPLRKKTWELALARRGDAPLTEEEEEEFLPGAKRDFQRAILMAPDEYIARMAREATPGISDEDVGKVLEYFQELKKADPLALDQKFDQTGPQLQVMRTGVNLEMGMYLSQMIGAFPYTNLRIRWREILSVSDELAEDAQVWSPLTHAFQALDFKFLDNVDPGFACSLRKDGRLEGFRTFLRHLWTEIGGQPDPAKAQSLARDFRDELRGEHEKAIAEWTAIDRDLLKQFGATVVGGIVGGAFSLQLPLFGVAVAGVAELINARLKRGEFRRRVPMSVFIDLSKRLAPKA
jgi:hypothetical protein